MSGDWSSILPLIVVILIFIYDIVAFVICFYAFREFKAMLLE